MPERNSSNSRDLEVELKIASEIMLAINSLGVLYDGAKCPLFGVSWPGAPLLGDLCL